jgi:hypothetical protein
VKSLALLSVSRRVERAAEVVLLSPGAGLVSYAVAVAP